MFVVHLTAYYYAKQDFFYIMCHSHSNDVIPNPNPIPISSPKATLIRMGIPILMHTSNSTVILLRNNFVQVVYVHLW